MSFGTRLKELRESKGLTQQELAEALKVKNTAVSNYELGISSPKEETMFRIFEYFNVTPNYMFQDEISVKIERQLSVRENELLSMYRSLDSHGLNVVDFIVKAEFERCAAGQENGSVKAVDKQNITVN